MGQLSGPDRTPGRRRALPGDPSRSPGTPDAARASSASRPPARRASRPAAKQASPPPERPVARPARRRAGPTEPTGRRDEKTAVEQAPGESSPSAERPTAPDPLTEQKPPPATRDTARPYRERSRQAARPAPTRRAEPSRRVGRGPAPAETARPRGDEPGRGRTGERARAALRHTLVGLWLLVLLGAMSGVVAVRVSDEVPSLVGQVAGGALSTALAFGLAVRTGGRPIWAALLTVAIAATAFATGWEPLLDGAAVGTGVLAATLGVMATIPAATFGKAIREALVATAIGWVGALGVVAYGPRARLDVDLVRFGYAVLGLSLVGAIALVYRLGAGLHGLGRRGYLVAGGAVLVLAFALAYSEALAQWGSRDLVGTLDDFRDSTKDALRAVPHPIMALLGYPALVWGVFMRARRRQGWWVCAFGVAATAPSATRLVAQEVNPTSVVLGAAYSVLAGVALGYLVIRGEQSLTGTHGRRARRDEEAEAHRPEPRRFQPLH